MPTKYYWEEPPIASPLIGTDLFCVSRGSNVGDPFNSCTLADVLAYIGNATTDALPKWNANTNTPTLVDSTVGADGIIYLVEVAGTTSLNGLNSWLVGDYAIFSGGTWQRFQSVEADRPQIINNKTVSATKILSSSSINDVTDETKEVEFDLTGVGTGTITTLKFEGGGYIATVPNAGANFTFASLALNETFSNKSISGLSNTITNIANSSLVNSSITINGTLVNLGGTVSVTAATPNSLTVSTGLQYDAGTTFDGSAPKTISIDSSVATLNGVQSLASKTLVNPIFNNIFSVYDDNSVYKMNFLVNPGSAYTSDLNFTIDTNEQSTALSINGALSFDGQFTTTGNFPVQQIYTAATNATFPPGTYTLARADEVTNGNVTKYVVGETLATAPYDDINTALAAANAEFLSTSKQQEVFIQPGEYNGFTPVQGVNISALGNSQNYFSRIIGARSAVKIISQVTISNSLDISISGLTLANSNPVQSCITSSGTNTAYVNFYDCVVQGNGTFPAFDGSNPNCYYSFNNTLLSSNGSFPVLFPTAGNFKFKNCVQIGSGNPSRFTASAAEYYNCLIKDSIELNSIGSLKIYNSTQETLGFYAAVIFQTNNCNFITDHSTFIVPSGITNYVFEGAAGSGMTMNNATFVDLNKIEPTITVNSYAQNTNYGNVFILTAAGNYNFTPANTILVVNKTVAATTTGFLPPPGTSIGAVYQMTDGKGDAATNNFILDAGAGYLINNAQTAIGNVAYKSISVRDIGTKYIII